MLSAAGGTWLVLRALAPAITFAAGAVHAGYSTLTDYPLGVIKLIHCKAHLALDAIGALALAATPFVTGQYRNGRRHWGAARGPLPVRAVSCDERADRQGRLPLRHRGRRANTEDPHRKIHDGPPAIKRVIA